MSTNDPTDDVLRERLLMRGGVEAERLLARATAELAQAREELARVPGGEARQVVVERETEVARLAQEVASDVHTCRATLRKLRSELAHEKREHAESQRVFAVFTDRAAALLEGLPEHDKTGFLIWRALDTTAGMF